MIKVQVRPNEPLEAALRRFKRQCNYAGIFRQSKKNSFFEKESDKRRREGRERLRNIQRAMRKLNQQHTGGRSRRRVKLRQSTVTPESALRDAEEAKLNEAAENAINASGGEGAATTGELEGLQIGGGAATPAAPAVDPATTTES